MKRILIFLLLLIAPCAYAQVTDFDDIANLKFWFEADSISGLSDGDNLATIENTWPNLVYTNGDSGLSGVNPREPTWETNEINTTKSVVFFDSSSSSDALIIDGTPDLTYARFTHQWDKTIFMVLKIPIDNSAFRVLLDSRDNNTNIQGMHIKVADNGTSLDALLNTHAGPVGSNNYNFNTANNVFTYGTWWILTAWVSTSDDTSRLYVDGAQVGKQVISGTEPSTNSVNPFTVGRQTISANERSLNGPVALIVIYDRALTDEERCQVRDLISCRFPEEFSDDAGCAVTCPSVAAPTIGSIRRRGLRR